MKFRTEIEKHTSPYKIGLKTGIVTIGSCFSDVLGSYLQSNKCNCVSNPFGTTYNIISIADILLTAIKKSVPDKELYVSHSARRFHYHYHSSLNGSTDEALSSKLTQINSETAHALLSCNYLIITLGTSWVYSLRDSGQIVSNCHKQPAGLFIKKFLEPEDQKKAFTHLRERLKKYNPEVKFILTVSPVRHIKDSISLNSVSKSALRLLCHDLENSFEDVFYFPSYEIMMDDLRDYRFYRSDLIHPNETAEEYIMDHFSSTWFDDELKAFIKEWSKLKTALGHRAFDPEGAAHQEFLKKTLNKLMQLQNKADMFTEIEILRQQIVSDFS